MVTLKTVRNHIWCLSKVLLWAILWPKKDKCNYLLAYCPLPRYFFVYRGSTFSEEGLYFTNPISRVEFNKRRGWCFMLHLSLQNHFWSHSRPSTWKTKKYIRRKMDVPESKPPLHCKMKLDFIWIVKNRIFLVIEKWTRECTIQPLYPVVSFSFFKPCSKLLIY